MKTFLEVEGKMGPIPASQFRHLLPDTNPNIRKDNATEKRKRAVPKRFRPSAAPKPTALQLPATVSKAPDNVKPKTDVPENRPPTLENVPVHESTPWPGTRKVSGNLFKDRNWLLPPNYLDNENKNEHKNETNITSPRPPVKEEEPKVNEQSAEKCGWGPDCPFCKNQEKEENKIQQQKTAPQPKVQKPQARRPKTLNVTDRYPSQTKAKQQWEAEMERLNSKYNLDCFSDSELDSRVRQRRTVQI